MSKGRKKKKNFKSKEAKKSSKPKKEDPSKAILLILGGVALAFAILILVVFVLK